MVLNFLWITWNPNRTIFHLPILKVPILWYSLLFVIGFLLGYWVFLYLLKKYLLNFPKYNEKDILNADIFFNPKNFFQKEAYKIIKIKNDFSNKNAANKLNNLLNDEHFFVNIYSKIKDTKLLKWIEKVYLSKSYKDPKLATRRMISDYIFGSSVLSIKKKALLITDKLLVYMVIATIIGARLGHLIFYEDPSYYLSNPLVIFKVWQGGLASHGAAVTIIIALIILSYDLKRKYYPKFSFIKLLDLVAAPTALAGVFIRIGNFFNQEIVGTPTDLPWGIIFYRPADDLPIVPRHPTQLYEAIFYFFVFLFLVFLSNKKNFYLKKGKLIGLFLIIVFIFRFFIEYLKPEQSMLIDSDCFIMGQYLSIPLIIIGLFFYFYENIFHGRKKNIKK